MITRVMMMIMMATTTMMIKNKKIKINTVSPILTHLTTDHLLKCVHAMAVMITIITTAETSKG